MNHADDSADDEGSSPPADDLLATLEREHALIGELLDVLEELAAEGAPRHLRRWAGALELMRRFADVTHHRKEELLLFPALEEASGGQGPLAAALVVSHQEHLAERSALREVDRALAKVHAGDERAWPRLQQVTRDLVAFLRKHMAEEDEQLYPQARRAIPPARLAQVAAACQALDLEQLGPAGLKRVRAELTRLRGGSSSFARCG